MTHPGATLEFAPVCSPGNCSLGLIGDFEVTKGLLLYSTQGFSTEGVLTQKQGGTIQLLDIEIEAVFNKQP